MKTVIKGYKYRLYPTPEQETQLVKTFGCCRFVYNQILAKKIDLYKTDKDSKQLRSKIDCNNYCNRELKKLYPWLKEVDKFALTNFIYNLDSAYQNFFREIKKGNKEQGFPKFKSKKNHYYSYKTNFNKTSAGGNIRLDFDNNKVLLPKLKWIKCKLHRQFEGKILFATISQVPSGKYYVSFNVECQHEELPKNNNRIGMDLGIKDLLITSDGQIFDNQRLTYKYEQQLTKLQRQLAHKKIGSNNYKKQTKKIARIHEKISNTRLNNLHQISSRIINDNQVIISEDLNIKGMVQNHNLAKAINDMGWYELTRQLNYKAEWNNKIYHKVDRFYASSQLCNVCGYQNKSTKDLGIREWECPVCHTKHDRDINASINILNEGLRNLKLA